MPPEALPAHIDIAFNEAIWRGIALRPLDREIALDFDVLTLPDGPGGSGHAEVVLSLHGATRIVASLRNGRWDDMDAEVLPLSLDELPDVVASFDGQPIYGWEFFDLPEESWERWSDRLSLDVRWHPIPGAHSMRLFQESTTGPARHLDARCWFESVVIRDTGGRMLDLEEFARGGRRWWDAMYSGDERTKSAGIVPLKRPENSG